MSSTGVPSIMSLPLKCSVVPSTEVSRTIDRPSRFGLAGARVAKTPCDALSRKGTTSRRSCAHWCRWVTRIR